MKGMCRYNHNWETQAAYKDWLRPFKGDNRKALCSSCDKVIELSNMGESALKSHIKSAKHIRITEQQKKTVNSCQSMQSFFKPVEKSDGIGNLSIPPPPADTCPGPSTSSKTLQSFVSKEDTIKAEILWTLKVVTSHQSYRSCVGVDKLFQNMFPDSQIARNFSFSG